MFEGARDFNQPIVNWDTSSVTSMVGRCKLKVLAARVESALFQRLTWMFHDRTAFKCCIQFQLARRYSLERMFRRASDFNQPIVNWDTSSVTSMVGQCKLKVLAARVYSA